MAAREKKVFEGKSKFPGKPSKNGNKKRINLKNVPRPQDNEFSKAATGIKIQLGLDLYDSALREGTSLSFKGFDDIEESATLKSRLQQKKRKSQFKKQINNDMDGAFQNDHRNAGGEINKTKQCFDGGGSTSESTVKTFLKSSCNYKINFKKTDIVSKNSIKVNKLRKTKNIKNNTKNLQNEAAKKLLRKAKQTTLNNTEFVLPSRSAHSSRVIKPNKKFYDPDEKKRRASKKKKTTNDNKDAAQPPSASKVILREARLQLDNSPVTLLDGPFSASSRSNSLSPNSQIKMKIFPGLNAPIFCEVCGAVRFYKFVKQARKFGLCCCESCRKFISKMLKKSEDLKGVDNGGEVECLKQQGVCCVPPVVRNAKWSLLPTDKNARCKACWLKLCIKKFNMSPTLKDSLLKLIPTYMRVTEPVDVFVFGRENINDFKRLNQPTPSTSSDNKLTPEKEMSQDEKVSKRGRKCLRSDSKKTKQNGKKIVGDVNRRQCIDLKGPRVKHVCRSASVVLGQPIATISNENTEKTKKDEKDCENCIETDMEVITEDVIDHDELVETVEDSLVPVCVAPENNLPGLRKNINAKKKNNEATQAENLISMEFWESYDPEVVSEYGLGLIGSEEFDVRALCFLCGSAGQERLLHCASCCEPYHDFCVYGGQMKQNIESDKWNFTWICPKCVMCTSCGQPSGQQQRCMRCDNSYHTECMDRLGGRMIRSPVRAWVCSTCLRCKSCSGVDVSMFVGNLPFCKPCFVLRQKGNYCPLCQCCYEDDDYDCKMMECGQCKCWVHAKCEGLSDEKYQVLSYLPDNVEYVCRMCCVIPPAPWWTAVENELNAGYLLVLKTLSQNRKACTMLKWSPNKQCKCRPAVARVLDFDDKSEEKEIEVEVKPPKPIVERKTSIEVINHPTEQLKLTLKITKPDEERNEMFEKFNIRECSVRVKKCLFNEDGSQDGSRTTPESPVKSSDQNENIKLPESPKPMHDSGVGTDDEMKTNCLSDEDSKQGEVKIEEIKIEDNRRQSCDIEKHECLCFLEIDNYNSRSKPSSLNLGSIRKKVLTSEYSSLHQFHEDMQQMVNTTQLPELMDLYHQAVKDTFPWFDPKNSKVNSSKPQVSGENTPIKNTPVKETEKCLVPQIELTQAVDYYYNNIHVVDKRVCLMCKLTGDCPSDEEGRLLYCGQNEWVHVNCALWSGEVYEEVDGSLQNVHSAISRGRGMRCSSCNTRGASIGCCAKTCAETFHFMCARRFGCVMLTDNSIYCPLHAAEANGKKYETDFSVRKTVYVELDKRKMKRVDYNQVRFVVGALSVRNLGRFIVNLSDYEDAIIPADFEASRLFWSCKEPWRMVRYHVSIKLVDVEQDIGADVGVNLTLDHTKDEDLLNLYMKQLQYFQQYSQYLDISEELENTIKEKKKIAEEMAKRARKEKLMKKVAEYEAKEEENNTADLLPPELEEAIFKDIPHDILDGISMQDIFLDINDIINDVDELRNRRNENDAQIEWTLPIDKSQENKELKRSKSDVISPLKRNMKNNQRSCSLNGFIGSRRKNSRNLDGTNLLQELKLSDDLSAMDTTKDLKSRLEDVRLFGKENKCTWQTRLLQVDGGVDSSSSGSEAGESPQRLIDENVTKVLPECSTVISFPSPECLDAMEFCENSPTYTLDSELLYDHLPQLDGADDESDSDLEYKVKRRKLNDLRILQVDGIDDCDSDTGVKNVQADEPVRCRQCHCTYRTTLSYQKHLENCCNDFMLSSSDEESSDDEKKEIKNETPPRVEIKTETVTTPPKVTNSITLLPSVNYITTKPSLTPAISVSKAESPSTPPKLKVLDNGQLTPKLEVKKPKIDKPRTYTRRKSNVLPNQLQQIIVQQPTQAPTLIVQDVATPNMVPGFIDGFSGQYVAVEQQGTYNKPILTNSVIPNTFQIQTPDSGIISMPNNMLSIMAPQPMQGIIIQQPQPTPATPIVMGPTTYEVIQDPQTGGMFLASHSQPMFYNMETIVSNTVMQTNQFVSGGFSQTSTQVFQASKLEQVVNMPSNYIVVNSGGITDKLVSTNDILCTPVVQPSMTTPTFQPYVQPHLTSMSCSPLRSIQPNKLVKLSPSRVPGRSPQPIVIAKKTPVKIEKVIPKPKQDIREYLNNFKFMDDEILSPTNTQAIKDTRQPMSRVPVQTIRDTRQPMSRAPVQAVKDIRQPMPRVPVQAVKDMRQPMPRMPVQVVKDTTQATVLVSKPSQMNVTKYSPSSISVTIPVSSTLPARSCPMPYNQLSYKPTSQSLPISTSIQNTSSPTLKTTMCYTPTTTSYQLPQTYQYSSTSPTTINKTTTSLPPMSSTTTFADNLAFLNKLTSSSSPYIPPNSSFPYPSSPLKKSIPPQGPQYITQTPKPPPPTTSTNTMPRSYLKTFSTNVEQKNQAKYAPLSVNVPQEPVSLPKRPCYSPFNFPPEQKCINMPSLDSPVEKINSPLPLKETSAASSIANTIKPAPLKEVENDQNNLTPVKLLKIVRRAVDDENDKLSNTNTKINTEEKKPKLIFEITSDDGLKFSATSLTEVWNKIYESLQEMRKKFKIPTVTATTGATQALGMQNHGLQHLLEQLPGAGLCVKYQPKFFKHSPKSRDDLTPVKENSSGCARTEMFQERNEHDPFGWLASRHRHLKKMSKEDSLALSKKANGLAMSMKYRNLKETCKQYVGVYRSNIHGKGLFCLRAIDSGEMVIEYAGEVIRSNLSDYREKYYTSKNIGCYMFRIDDHQVVDATMKGNAARFINHSCEPNCYSKVVDILGKKHIVIFALRKINVMEELTYDYKFPFEDEKISCHCQSKKCRKYLN